MGALEHSSNVIWHTASAPSLEAKILCTLLNVHKLVSLFKDYACRQIMLMTSFLVIVFKLHLPRNLNEPRSHVDWSCLCTRTLLTHTTYCVTATSAYVCVFVYVMWNDNDPVGVLPLADKLHFMNAQ